MLNYARNTRDAVANDRNVIIFATTVPVLLPLRPAIGSSYFIAFPIANHNNPNL